VKVCDHCHEFAQKTEKADTFVKISTTRGEFEVDLCWTCSSSKQKNGEYRIAQVMFDPGVAAASAAKVVYRWTRSDEEA